MVIVEKLLELKKHGGDCPDYIRDECTGCEVCELYATAFSED